MVGEAAAFMAVEAVVFVVVAVEAVVFMVVVAVASARAVEEGLEGVLFRHPRLALELPVPQPLLPCARGVGLLHGPATIIPGREVVSLAGISEMEILRRRLLRSPTDDGIHLAAQLGAVEVWARKRKLGPQVTAAGMFLAGIVQRGLPDRSAAFRVRDMRSGRILPSREMLSPSRNRFRRFTTRLGARSLPVPVCGPPPPFPAVRVSLADQRLWLIGDSRVV
jgi:hypothetical protein